MFESVIVATLAIGSLALLVSGRARVDTVGFGLMVLLVATGVLDVTQAIAGFANSTVITLAGLYVIGEALTRTGSLDFVTTRLQRVGGSPRRTILVVCYTAAIASAFISDTAVVLVFLPIAAQLCRDLEIPLSRLLMPMGFSAILGGTVTLVGSSVNILASGSSELAGGPALGVFTQTPLGLPLTLFGVPLVVWLSEKLLPERYSLTSALAAAPAREYVTEVDVGPNSPWSGQTVQQAVQSLGVSALFLVREGHIHWPPIQDLVIRPHDTIMLSGHVAQLAELSANQGLLVVDDTRFDPQTMHLFELGVTPGSRLVGQRIGDLPLWRDYRVLAVAVLRGNHHLRERVGDLDLRHGDLILVCGDRDAQERLRASSDLHLLLESGHPMGMRGRGQRALIVLGLVIAGFTLAPALGISERLPIPFVSMLGAMAMVAIGCLTPRRAYRSIDWPILVLVAGSLALGSALEQTGLARKCADAVVGLTADFGPAAALSGLLLIGTLLNQFTSPYAVAALLTPIAVATGTSLGAPSLVPFVLAIALAGSNAFVTPFGHQVNLMIIGPGGYRYQDFVRLGLPMCFFYWAFVSVALALWS
ncbi:MAG: SLC13 family permease [Planctomycetota bacterium]